MTLKVEGTCHCGDAHWMLKGDPGSATACNCTLCRRYGALWAYDYEGERISISGPSTSYTRVGKADPKLEILFCPKCGCVLCWRGALVSGGRNIRGGAVPQGSRRVFQKSPRHSQSSLGRGSHLDAPSDGNGGPPGKAQCDTV